MSKQNFPQQTVAIRNKYSCVCGNKFYRKVSDWFTMNPFNQLTVEESRTKIASALQVIKKPCPECQTMCLPVVKEPEYV